MSYSSIQNQTLFWDTNLASLNTKKHKEFIIARIIETGRIEDIHWMFETYSRQEIIQVIVSTRLISTKTALFWKNILDIKEDIRCLSNQYRKTQKLHWMS